MATFLLIETSTSLCSVALSQNGEIIGYKSSSAPKAHASLTAVFVDELLKENHIKLDDCDAICVSSGPGSYTGLRVGVSTAKGLCFGSKKPLIGIGTLDTLVYQAITENLCPDNCTTIIPMIDARRMEVYTAVYTTNGERLTEISPMIVDENSFQEHLDKGIVLFIGDGAGKCSETIIHPNARFVQCNPKASAMLAPAINLFQQKKFEDVAYFEPFYLKEFVATVSKKQNNILHPTGK